MCSPMAVGITGHTMYVPQRSRRACLGWGGDGLIGLVGWFGSRNNPVVNGPRLPRLPTSDRAPDSTSTHTHSHSPSSPSSPYFIGTWTTASTPWALLSTRLPCRWIKFNGNQRMDKQTKSVVRGMCCACEAETAGVQWRHGAVRGGQGQRSAGRTEAAWRYARSGGPGRRRAWVYAGAGLDQRPMHVCVG